MAKITDSQYFLPSIHPLIGGDVLDSGKSKPMIINGICTKDKKRSDYVVKFCSSPHLGPEASCRELIASFIAMQLDLFVAPPAIIDLTEEFVETLKGRDCYPIATKSLGNNFGSQYIKGDLSVFIENQELNERTIERAVEVYAFDLFTW